ncbi:SufD family Fe-S cluster assembly protein [Altererythrobacter sp. RZ02]|uniref:SufD family Fe-S cluster assembly protein n=1 Tax=Pontixanthobacter rizhaonensis TaxID=2730337 RepID=A0A848QGF7_9SPHN|nr:SufD family Fe-S cluster assembly protein [Pontixanthobacter rizhaonensis]NMW32701.1 SufD family Fe-S cluster assembly protein [Pontixanthobacter rizhaonensis]
MTVTALPTTREEDWRYSDAEFLKQADPVVIHNWRTVTVLAGETVREVQNYLPVDHPDGVMERVRVHVGAGGRFESFATLAGNHYGRVEVEVTLEDGAHFEFGGVTLGGGDSVQEFVTRTKHAHPNATSNQVIRAVQWGKSVGNFLGRIEVARDAQKTDAGQNFRAILLEKGATANTKPELEIFADDVLCAHGAAIGQLDEQARYYMAARGIPPHIARKLLIQAFIGDAFAELDDAEQREAMLDHALAALDAGAM